jgi:hypothetical protein
MVVSQSAKLCPGDGGFFGGFIHKLLLQRVVFLHLQVVFLTALQPNLWSLASNYAAGIIRVCVVKHVFVLLSPIYHSPPSTALNDHPDRVHPQLTCVFSYSCQCHRHARVAPNGICGQTWERAPQLPIALARVVCFDSLS